MYEEWHELQHLSLSNIDPASQHWEVIRSSSDANRHEFQLLHGVYARGLGGDAARTNVCGHTNKGTCWWFSLALRLCGTATRVAAMSGSASAFTKWRELTDQ